MNNKYIKFNKKPKVKNPYLLAAWPGMGNVSIRAAEFLCENLQPVEFAELSASGFFYPHDAWIVDGQVERPRLPSGKFYFWKNNQGRHDLIIFICESQPSVEKGYNYAKLVLDVAATFNVKRVFTFASMPSPIDHTQDSRVWGTATDKKILNELRKFDISVMLSGQISGLNGLLLSVARERGIEGICFLAEIPLYALQIENPKASKAVLGVFLKLLQVKMDFNALDERAKIIEDEIEKLVDYFKSGTGSDPISEEDIEVIKKTLASVTRLPESARLKIEELFKVAEKDITKANELKNELDRWQIYKEYEDRFLDLFKQKEKDNN